MHLITFQLSLPSPPPRPSRAWLQLAFHHWRANAVSKATGAPTPLQGIGLILFNERLQIRDVYEFVMRPHANLRRR